MKSAKEEAKELIDTANILKKYTDKGCITIEGSYEEFKKNIDDFEEFLKIIDKANYCIKNRKDTYLGLFPADENEEIVFIEK